MGDEFLEKICICKSVTKDTIVKAAEKGSDTYEKIKRATGAATGACKGARCECKIKELVNNK